MSHQWTDKKSSIGFCEVFFENFAAMSSCPTKKKSSKKSINNDHHEISLIKFKQKYVEIATTRVGCKGGLIQNH